MRGFARTASNERANFYGDVDIGDALSLDELREMYDAVVLAVGAAHDRTLGIPGEDKAGVVGSASFVNWYNAHPDFIDRTPDLDTSSVVIIGAGNVAIDVARVLVKTPAEMAATDLPDYAAEPIHAAPISDVYMVARRGPVEAKFTNVELREMGHLEQCVPQVAAADLPESVTGEMSDRDRRVREKNLQSLRTFAEREADEKPKRVHFVFFASPVEILGDTRVEAIRFERTRVENGRRRHRRALRDRLRPGGFRRGLPLHACGRRALRPQAGRRRERCRPGRARPLRGRLDQARSDRGHRHQQAGWPGRRPADPRRSGGGGGKPA